MLRNLYKTANRAKSIFTNTAIFSSKYNVNLIPRFSFSENKPPKGFEKFKREKKIDPENSKTPEKPEQKIDLEESQNKPRQSESKQDPQPEKKSPEERIENDENEQPKKQKKSKDPEPQS